MHEMSLVHGDVKPKNIVVSDDLRSVKIIDFGSAGGECSPTAECKYKYTRTSFLSRRGFGIPTPCRFASILFHPVFSHFGDGRLRRR